MYPPTERDSSRMSAVTSPSPPSTDAHHLNLAAFNHHSFDDPFLATTSNAESGLQPEEAGDTPAYTNEYPSGLHALAGTYNIQRTGSPSSGHSRHGIASNSDHSHPEPGPSNSHTLSPSPPSAQDFLSPNGYSSENIYSDLSLHTTPSIDDAFLFENTFGIIPDAESQGFLDPTQELVSENQFARKEYSAVSEPTKRSSTGAAVTSQLLSPVLTNTPSPASEYRNLHVGPAPLGGSHQGMAPTSDTTSRPINMDVPDVPPVNVHRTPALTGSSSSESLEFGPTEPIARAPSPIVKVSLHSRGDSPSRAQALLGRGSSKRSRTSRSSAHLSPGQENDSSGDDDENYGSSDKIRAVHIPPQSLRAADGSWIPSAASGQAGIDPTERGVAYVLSIKELEEQRHIAEKNADVEVWLSHSEAGSEAGDDEPPSVVSRRRRRSSGKRRRAKSTGDPPSGQDDPFGLGIGAPIFDDSGIPGPGALLDEESGDEDDDMSDTSEYSSDSPPAQVDPNTQDEPGYFPPVEEEEPSPRQFYRAKPWHDPPYESGDRDMRVQPGTSNAAIMRFKQRADNVETASRAATWGTRRLSEADVSSVVGHDSIFKSLSLRKDKGKDKSDRRSSFLNQLLPKRSNSNLKKRMAETLQHHSSSESIDKTKKRDSVGSVKSPHHLSSLGRSTKFPPLNTSGAVLTMTSQIAAIGGSGSVGASSPGPSTVPWNRVIKRTRSKSEIPRSSVKPTGTPGLAELMTSHGGPPMPTLASPMQEKPSFEKYLPQQPADDEEDEEDDEDETMDDKGVTMDLKVRTDNIVPTFVGFKTHVCQLNPRLKPFLVDRIGQEQLRRYKKLIDNKVKHIGAVSNRKCGSGRHCFALGGEATLLPPRTSAKDPEMTYAHFQVPGTGSDDETNAFAEGAVTAAQFPPGVPLPPVKRLPAEFECSLCFRVKKFQKPSDWTKHVHEDVQPFTCTFPNCTEPKSFKRKADWVRHENERHRQLEWWTCNMQDCSHTCYRKDNFVQHLVREHKKPEPKLKGTKTPRGSSSSKAKPIKIQAELIEDWSAHVHDPEIDSVWLLVEECHHDTKKLPKNEPCKFCGNVCNSWKKLTVHLAKHMEQIAMPVLELVKQREVSPDTIISPVERGTYQQQTASPTSPVVQPKIEPSSVSPYQMGSTQLHPMSELTQPIAQPGYYGPTSQPTEGYPMSNYAMQLQMQASMAGYNQPSTATYNTSSYPRYQDTSSRQFVPVNNPASYPPPYNAVPRQQARDQAINLGVNVSSVPTTIYEQQQQMYQSPVESIQYVYQAQPNMSQGQAMPSGMPTAMQYDNSGMASGMSYPQAQEHPQTGYMPGPQNYPYQQQ